MFISHDLGVVAGVADRVAIMYAGKIVEIGTAEEIFIRLAILIHGDYYLRYLLLQIKVKHCKAFRVRLQL